MRVGIITFHRAHNFGAVLQAYALQEYIQSLGLKAEIIDYYNPKVYAQYELFSFVLYSKVIKLGATRLLRTLGGRIYNFRKRHKRHNNFDRFMEKYLNTSPQKNIKASDLDALSVVYDALICGSDQIWNAEITDGLDPVYFLRFVSPKKARKIAYAASIGTDSLTDIEIISEYINSLDFISVRENSAIKLLQPFCNKSIENVLDPTLLIPWNKWAEIVIEPVQNNKYILVYEMQFNRDLIEIVEILSQELQLGVIHFGSRRKFSAEIARFSSVGPSEFLGLIQNASYVITNSFHGTIFSILSSKEFLSVPHTTLGSRMIDLLEKLGLNDRICCTVGEFNKLEPINYVEVNKKLDLERQRSLDFLKRALES